MTSPGVEELAGHGPTAGGGHWVEERILFPAGFDPSIPEHRWQVARYTVEVRFDPDRGAWIVQDGSRPVRRLLTSDGRWVLSVQTGGAQVAFGFSEACLLAEQVVDTVSRGGQRWSDWLAYQQRAG